MVDLRHVGVGFPNGAADNGAVFALPSPHLLMLATEGRYHHDAAVAFGKRVLWRAIPRLGKRPAELGWSPSRFVAETINLTDAPTRPIADFVWANELDLNSERGDQEDDFADLERRYALIGGWALSVVSMLKQWSPATRIHWPAWTPDHGALDHLGLWREAANLADCIDFHAYDSLANIQRQYAAYRQAFPAKPLALTEWHCKGDLLEEATVLQWLALTMAEDPLFDAAYFFIWRWWDHPGWWSDAWDIEHDPDRLALFTDPPTVPVLQEPPMPQNPDLTDEPDHLFTFENLWPTIKAAGEEFGFDPQVLAGIMLQESGWRNWRVHRDGTGHGLLGLDDNGMLPAFERWSGIQVGRGQSAISIPIVPQIRYAASALSDYARRLGGPYAAARAWHRGEGLMNDARGQQYEQLIRTHVAALFSDGETPTVPKVTYDRDEPAIPQNDGWSCAPTSTRWAMKAIGRNPSEAWMESQMKADGIVTEEQGLMDASGHALAEWITAQYGEFGYAASNENPISWEALAAEFMAPSNPYPGLIGGRAWNHWAGLRSYDPGRDVLLLANPDENWKSVGAEMTRAEFAALGPFSLVRIVHPDLIGAPVPPPFEPPPPPIQPAPISKAEIDAVIATLQGWRDRVPA